MKPDRAIEIRSEMLLLATVFIWASNYPIAKFAIARLDIFVFNGIRFVVAAAVLAAVFIARSEWKAVDPSHRWELLRAGFIGNVVYQIAFIVGLSMTTAGNSAVLLATAPLWTVVIHARLHREKIHRQVWLGMFVSLVGILMIIIGSGKKLVFGGTELYGDLIALSAAGLWAWNTNLQKPLLTRYSASQLSLMMMIVGAIGLTLVAIPGCLKTDWTNVSWQAYVASIVSGALSIGLANLFWSQGVQRLGPHRTANFGNLVPVLAFVISYFTLDERLNWIQILGATVTVAGVWVARR
jgi:drug/metabolite transporter (DMT)-like permease